MASHLYVSFWDLCLDNLPQGRFERRVIGAGEASAMICAARADKTLLCVSKDDLLAPYRTKERRRHQELCTVLRASYNCPLRFEDFLTTLDDEGTAVQSITPLQVAELQPRDRLLVVTCDYQLADKTKASAEPLLRQAALSGKPLIVRGHFLSDPLNARRTTKYSSAHVPLGLHQVSPETPRCVRTARVRSFLP